MTSHKEDFSSSTIVAKIPKVSVNPATGKEYTDNRETLLINREVVIKPLMYSDMPRAREFREAIIKKLRLNECRGRFKACPFDNLPFGCLGFYITIHIYRLWPIGTSFGILFKPSLNTLISVNITAS
ncbi:hypothetical protein L7E55_15120 [Pelotomaculum isophthalicicum JI]|uniref:Uncharacterized protein n=1 Tax=Pelotomaculum isophthalicicum JI TaxID=947010 RepID=A0A9X4H0A2_9FIRM|nr:hypothetical protein [Pelotomaculum isophthalicicum]MDF9409665.1 hypothetical protein [Pelotomaculum isophthalicicum JI]